MDLPPVSLHDVRGVCWLIYVLKRIPIFLVHNSVCRQRVEFLSACYHVVSAWVDHAIFLQGYWFYSCPQHLVSFQRDNRDMLHQWDKRVNGSRDRYRMFLNLLIENAHVLRVLLGVLDPWSYTGIESYHSFNSGNAAPKSFDLR